MIKLNNVSKWYGHFQVLTDCTTQVAKGDVVVVCGPSGSGKSTLIKTVNGLEPFQKGEITVDGVSLTVNTIDDSDDGGTVFGLNIIPHTWQVTAFGDLQLGQAVNLEIDVLARYLARMRDRLATS